MATNPEAKRLVECREQGVPWRKWGPYLSERQWGTVREDYSENGDAWSYFSHDQARSRAYGWGEDGLAGFSDDKEFLCLALTLWNGVDPILKERLFGLTNAEGNHGEDVKEYYFYLDATPTHSYLRWLYKYPQKPYPYDDLVQTNRTRSRHQPEYELLDSGVFDEDRYFDVVVEYAKAGPEDVLMRIAATNRGPAAAPLHLLPTCWFRDVWSIAPDEARPIMRGGGATGMVSVTASHRDLGDRWLACAGAPALLFTENESNRERLFGEPNRTRYVKDAFHHLLVHGETDAVNPDGSGTKAAAHYRFDVPAGETVVVRLRLADRQLAAAAVAAPAFDALVDERRADADAFYAAVLPARLSDDERLVARQALAGMLWSEQHYFFDIEAWLASHGASPLADQRVIEFRNIQWFHMVNDDVISMPDKWEYPWYAAWDLAFHTLPLSLIDLDFAKQQLQLMLRDVYMHPSGQLPAYEWNFGDVNPPVHAWAALALYRSEQDRAGAGDVDFLRHVFHGLANNFTWWVNRKDPSGRNAFEGGFLGLDNIGVFDRSRPLPTGGRLEQADGTAWMVFFAQCMFEICLELATHDHVYEKEALRYLQHFFWIAAALDRLGERQDEMWDEQDGFFYDVLLPSGADAMRLKVRSMVGLLPLCAVTVIESSVLARFPWLVERIQSFLLHHGELVLNIASPMTAGVHERRLLSPLGENKLRRILARLLDEGEFLGPHGIRALSRIHLEHPFVFQVHGEEYRVDYEPAESTTGLFGGNSNWRGPVWLPVNMLVVRALVQYYRYYGDAFTVECPTGSGRQMTLFDVAREISTRLVGTFLRDGTGRRPVFGGAAKFQSDPHWRDCLQFYEYFHGDNGAGLGASHQTGWTGLVAFLIHYFGSLDAASMLAASGPRAPHNEMA